MYFISLYFIIYSALTGAVKCTECPPGWLCVEGEEVQLCPEGHYCLGGKMEDILPCPPGTYNPKAGQIQVEQCSLCSAGENSAPAMPTSLVVLIAFIGVLYLSHPPIILRNVL